MPGHPFYRRWLLLVLLAVLLGGCGLKGDLYLPHQDGESTSRQH